MVQNLLHDRRGERASAWLFELTLSPALCSGLRIVTLWEVTEQGGQIHVSTPNFRDWKEHTHSFDAMALHSSADFGGPTTVLGGREATRATVTAVSADFFRVFRVQPVLGRLFAADEFSWGSNVALVSHGFWRDQLGGNPDLTALTVDVYGHTLQVIGVMPGTFRHPGETDIWGPLPPVDDSRRAHNWQVVARLRPDATLAVAATRTTRITLGPCVTNLETRHPTVTAMAAATLQTYSL